MKRNYRLFYPAGLISIVLLPLLCIWDLNKQHAFDKVGAMDVAYYNYDNNVDNTFNNWFKKIPSIRKYTEIEFTGNAKDDSLRLQYAQLEMKRIFNSKDSINGIHIKFTKHAKYWNFVKAIDICQAQGIFPFLNKDDIWVYYFPPVIDDSIQVQGSLCCCIQIVPENISLIDGVKTKLEAFTKLPKIYFLSLLFFMLMCYYSRKSVLRLHRPARTHKVYTL